MHRGTCGYHVCAELSVCGSKKRESVGNGGLSRAAIYMAHSQIISP